MLHDGGAEVWYGMLHGGGKQVWYGKVLYSMVWYGMVYCRLVVQRSHSWLQLFHRPLSGWELVVHQITSYLPYHTVPYHTIPYCSVPYQTNLFSTLPYHAIPQQTIRYQNSPKVVRHPNPWTSVVMNMITIHCPLRLFLILLPCLSWLVQRCLGQGLVAGVGLDEGLT